MKQFLRIYIGVFLLLILNSGKGSGQPCPTGTQGETVATAFDAGQFSPCGRSFTCTVNNTGYLDNYTPEFPVGANNGTDPWAYRGKDIVYKFEITGGQTEVAFSNCGSSIPTALVLLNGNGSNSGYTYNSTLLTFTCGAPATRVLNPGFYYLVADATGYPMQNGNMSIAMDAKPTTIPPGSSFANAIDAGTIDHCGSTAFTSDLTNSTQNCFKNLYGGAGNDLFYKFKLDYQSDVTISTCGSGINTSLHLVNRAPGTSGTFTTTLIQTDAGANAVCSGKGYITVNLQPGTYYVVSEGAGAIPGNIQTSIQAAANNPAGATLGTALNAGTLSCGDTYTDTRNNSPEYCFKNDYGQASDDIFYKFTVTAPDPAQKTRVRISHCSSALAGDPAFKTVLTLLQDNGTGVLNNDITGTQWLSSNTGSGPACPGSGAASLEALLLPGNYIAVSEGLGNYAGSLVTSISASPEGADLTYAITVPCVASGADTRNNAAENCYGNTYAPGSTSDDICYKFTVPGTPGSYTQVGISHAGSGFHTSLTLLQETGFAGGVPLTAFVNDNTGYGPLTPGSNEASLQELLLPGTYYLIAEGNGTNLTGNLITTFSAAALRAAGAAQGNAINAGAIACGTVYTSPAVNTNPVNCYGRDFSSQTSDDVYYKFTIAQRAVVTISHCNSDFDTFIALLGSSGSPLAVSNYGDQCPNTSRASLKRLLEAGTYYVVSKGFGNAYGNLITTISPAAPPVTVPDPTVQVSAGGSITLTAGGGFTNYTWSPAAGLSATSGASVTASPASTTTYTVTGTNNGACGSVPATVKVQVGHVNYVTEHTVLVAGKTTAGSLDNLPPEEKHEDLVFLDGLGRPLQRVSRAGSPGKNDLVVPIEYDHLGRTPRAYLPYTDTNNNFNLFKEDALEAQREFYASGNDALPVDDGPFAETAFEQSPLERVLEQGAPGAAWQPGSGHTVKFDSRANTTGDAVKIWTFDPATGACAAASLPYGSGLLTVHTTTDEHGIQTLQFTDKQGRLLLKKTLLYNNGSACTYYVYDNFNRQRAVFPPLAVEKLAGKSWAVDAEVAELMFTYAYDARGRLTRKKAPGAAEEYMVYNRLDQPVMTQNGRQRNELTWQFVKYDVLGRPVQTGLFKAGSAAVNTLDYMQSGADAYYALYEKPTADATWENYTNNTFPTLRAGDQVLSVNYYGGYSANTRGDADFFDGHSLDQAIAPFNRLDNKLTITKVYVPDTGIWLYTMVYYDDKGRVIQTKQDTHLGGTDITTNQYDFAGRLTDSETVHFKDLSYSDINLKTVQQHTYDHMGRLLTVSHAINEQPAVTLTANAYNELGQLKAKHLQVSPDPFQLPLQSVNYRYNIRGWLTNINNPTLAGQEPDDFNDVFALSLTYNEAVENGLTAPELQYNGNVAQAQWITSTDWSQRGYNYLYDERNQLLAAEYQTTGPDPAENYSMSAGYDLNGNITNLERYGLTSDLADTGNKTFGQIDNLVYEYQGNRLKRVDDGIDSGNGTTGSFNGDFGDGGIYEPNDYDYDAAGNLVMDHNKGIRQIDYNHLNLPVMIDFGNENLLFYQYDGGGRKLRKEVYENGALVKTTDYAGGLQYEDGTLKFALTPEGRAMPGTNEVNGLEQWVYEFHLKDHLGNLRASIRDGVTQVLRVTGEAVNAEAEEKEFKNVAATRQLDAAHARTGAYAMYLEAGGRRRVGPDKTMPVKRGDKVKAAVYAHYDKAKNKPLPFGGLLAGLAVAPFGKPAAGSEGAGATVPPAVQAGLALSPAAVLAAAGKKKMPAAYLRYVVYDADSNYVESALRPLSPAAAETWELLTLDYRAKQDGYVEVYLANESQGGAWFDDLALSYQPLLVQENHYDPFGLNLAGIEMQGDPDHLYQFGGKEKQVEHGLHWQDFGARNYDAQLGRWHNPDPLDQYGSPYVYCGNNPTNFIDPSGMYAGVAVPGIRSDPGIETDRERTNRIYGEGLAGFAGGVGSNAVKGDPHFGIERPAMSRAGNSKFYPLRMLQKI